ncbi:MAG: hypothetical protein KKH95_13155 [Gammaproteobacteria bacterium]|nr:hypothetical protein [Gammaproteobacteria bacterium]
MTQKRSKERTEMITREVIEERIKLLQSERDQMLINLGAYNGAISDCQYWLDLLAEPQEVEKEE